MTEDCSFVHLICYVVLQSTEKKIMKQMNESSKFPRLKLSFIERNGRQEGWNRAVALNEENFHGRLDFSFFR